MSITSAVNRCACSVNMGVFWVPRWVHYSLPFTRFSKYIAHGKRAVEHRVGDAEVFLDGDIASPQRTYSYLSTATFTLRASDRSMKEQGYPGLLVTVENIP